MEGSPSGYTPRELLRRVQNEPLVLPLRLGRKAEEMLNPAEDDGRGLAGDDREEGDAAWARLKESRFRKFVGRLGDLEVGVVGERGVGLVA